VAGDCPWRRLQSGGVGGGDNAGATEMHYSDHGARQCGRSADYNRDCATRRPQGYCERTTTTVRGDQNERRGGAVDVTCELNESTKDEGKTPLRLWARINCRDQKISRSRFFSYSKCKTSAAGFKLIDKD